MLKSIELENFKAFGQRTTIPLAPITLIFGQNSSGKSSILQSLNLLKQTRENRDADALLLPRAESGLADLGSFHEMLFDHDQERVLRIGLAVSRQPGNSSFPSPYARDYRDFGLEFGFARRSTKDEISLEELKVCEGDSANWIANYAKCDLPETLQRYTSPMSRIDRQRPRSTLHGTKCSAINEEAKFWKSSFEWLQREKPRLLGSLKKSETNSYLNSDRSSKSLDQVEDDSDEQQSAEQRQQILNEFIEFISSEFSFDDFMKRVLAEHDGQYLACEGFIPVTSEHAEDRLDINSIIRRIVRTPNFRRAWTVDLGTFAVFVGRQIDEVLSRLFPLGPFRKSPSRWYVFSGTTPQDVGFEGQSLPDLIFRKEEVRKETNDWLKRLDIGYEIRTRSLGNPGSDLFELRLLDTRRKNAVEVGLADVGFGISQILPLVVQSLAASDQIISVEQPEVHIHPRLQADLGDLLIEATQEPRRNQFLIETHSEHLALRLQRRVREKQIAPEDISILYVSRGENGSTVTQLRLDEDGDFMDEFPGGFFPERLRELR